MSLFISVLTSFVESLDFRIGSGAENERRQIRSVEKQAHNQ